MPATPAGFGTAPPRERLIAAIAVAAVQIGLALALLSGLRVTLDRKVGSATRLISFILPKPPPPSAPPVTRQRAARSPKSPAAASGAAPGPRPVPRPAHLTPVMVPTAAPAAASPAGGGTTAGALSGAGAGSGSGTSGQGGGGSGEGGRDLEQIAGEILPSDYPRNLGGRGGRVGIAFTVGVNGRVTRCAVTRPSGIAELDALTCRLIQQRFVYRPSTDDAGRPIADEVEGEHEWVTGRR
ncbi:MAG: energy transducer TonB [Sphingomicrobium sp.]